MSGTCFLARCTRCTGTSTVLYCTRGCPERISNRTESICAAAAASETSGPTHPTGGRSRRRPVRPCARWPRSSSRTSRSCARCAARQGTGGRSACAPSPSRRAFPNAGGTAGRHNRHRAGRRGALCTTGRTAAWLSSDLREWSESQEHRARVSNARSNATIRRKAAGYYIGKCAHTICSFRLAHGGRSASGPGSRGPCWSAWQARDCRPTNAGSWAGRRRIWRLSSRC